jgi:O-antigen ligase
MPKYTERAPDTLRTNLLFSLSAALLCFAPLMRGGRMSFALLVLEVLGVLLLLLAFWSPLEKERIPKLAWAVILAGMAIPLLYLLPMPVQLWQILPGHGLYSESLDLLEKAGTTPDYLALSLVPQRTASSLLAMLPLSGIFITTLILPRQQVIKLVYVFLVIASVEAALGLIQYGSGANWAFWWDIQANKQMATGTYPNRDHFAALMELALPLAIGLTAYYIHNPHRSYEEKEKSHAFNHALIFFTLSILLILAGIFSRSRAGLLLTIVGIILSSITFSRHAGGKQAAGFNTVLIGVSTGVATSIGLIPVLNRFAQDPMEDGRWEIYAAVMQGLKQFFPVGSGPGTFQPVFLAFQPPELRNFVNHAHNDYLELLFETGIIGIVLMLLILILYVYGWMRLRKHHWGHFHFIQTAAGTSLLLFALHGFMDFNFHTPANALFFAFLGGIFLHSQRKKSPQ